ncbi:ATP-binding protein [Chrysiogenes arsenatis]|uniref:ATP-binding protein n=1 Tax=Chrysiogenes arsenatis TaxID=309797 RepID=UPI00040DB8F8|nr:ATP-binding protein [Chrysiogenes arsenatis]
MLWRILQLPASRIFLTCTLIFAVVVSGILFYAMSRLRQEAISTNVQIAALHAHAFEDHLTQNLEGTENLFRNFATLIDTNPDDTTLLAVFLGALRSAPYLRSLSYLNSDGEVIISTYTPNIGLKVDTSRFFPIPFHSDTVLRIDVPWIGRDLAGALWATPEMPAKSEDLLFVPVIRSFTMRNSSFTLLASLNVDYYLNYYLKNMVVSGGEVSIKRMDGITMFSTDPRNQAGAHFNNHRVHQKMAVMGAGEFIDQHDSHAEKIYAFRASRHFPLAVIVDFDLEAILIQWHAERRQVVGMSAGLALLCIVLGLALVYRHQKMKLELADTEEMEANLRKGLLESIPDAILMLDANGNIIMTNERWNKFCERHIAPRPTRFAIGWPYRKVAETLFGDAPDYQPFIVQVDAIITGSDDIATKEFSLGADSHTFYFQLEIHPLHESKRNGAIVVQRDITTQRRSDEKMKTNEIQYRSVVNALSSGIIVQQFSGEITTCNYAARQILGIECANTISCGAPHGCCLREILQTATTEDGVLLKPHQFPSQKTLDTGKPQRNRILKVQRHDEGIVWLLVNTEPLILNDATQPFAVVTSLADITLLKDLENEKEQQQAIMIQQAKLAELGGMIGVIAHQWKQPLNAISLLTMYLPTLYAEGALGKEELDEHVTDMMEQLRFMSQTIEDFRNFYKPSLTSEMFDIREACSSVLKLCESQLRMISADVDVEPGSPLYTPGYRSEFQQVMLNLFVNSRDVFTERSIPQGLVKVSFQQTTQATIIRVHDNGGGIPEHLLPDGIFQPFVSTKGEKGTGIGLAVSRKIIMDKMKGKIWAENIGNGACFTIELPRETIG